MIKEAIEEYQKYVKTALKPKKVPMQPGVMLDSHDCPEFPDPWGNGMMARYNKGLILWKSKMQKAVSLSTAEAEYYVIYLRNLLANMGFPEKPNTPVYEDNTACIE